MKYFFFSVGIFPPGIFLREMFSFEIGLQDIFFWNHPYGHTSIKSQMVGHSLGLRHEFLPHLKEDCVPSQKNVGEASYSIAGVAGVRKGRGGNLGARPRARNPLSVPFQTPGTQATGGPEKELGQTCVQSQSSREIRIRRNPS